MPAPQTTTPIFGWRLIRKALSAADIWDYWPEYEESVEDIENTVASRGNFVKAPTNLIPQMTSANTPSGIASDGGNLDGNWPAWKAMTISEANQGWLMAIGSYNDAWVQYQFATAKTVKSFSIIPWSVDSFPNRSPNTFRLLGSNDGVNFDTLGSYTCPGGRTLNGGNQWEIWVRSYFLVTTPGSYTHYRLKVDTTQGGYAGITELALYETE